MWYGVSDLHARTWCWGFAGRDKKQPGVAQPAEGAAGEEAQVSSKPVEWPTVPPGSKRQRSRLHQTPGSAPAGAAPEELSPHAVRPAQQQCTPCLPPLAAMPMSCQTFHESQNVLCSDHLGCTQHHTILPSL